MFGSSASPTGSTDACFAPRGRGGFPPSGPPARALGSFGQGRLAGKQGPEASVPDTPISGSYSRALVSDSQEQRLTGGFVSASNTDVKTENDPAASRPLGNAAHPPTPRSPRVLSGRREDMRWLKWCDYKEHLVPEQGDQAPGLL